MSNQVQSINLKVNFINYFIDENINVNVNIQNNEYAIEYLFFDHHYYKPTPKSFSKDKVLENNNRYFYNGSKYKILGFYKGSAIKYYIYWVKESSFTHKLCKFNDHDEMNVYFLKYINNLYLLSSVEKK